MSTLNVRGVGIFLCCMLLISCVYVAHVPSTYAQGETSYEQRATLGIQALQSWYDLDTGLYKTTGWWNSANAITVLADYARLTHSSDYNFVFANTFFVAQKTAPGFINKYYDDEGWWALAWIDAYEVTHDKRYLAAAESIFTDMTYGWDNTCSGGIWWSKDRKYKNAIANELFLSVAAELVPLAKEPRDRADYLTWARREWDWFAHSGMINSSSLVNDGLTDKCENNRQTTWTYNQGVILGGLVALNRIDHKAPESEQANKIAAAALSSLTDTQGILHDSCEPKCGGDGTQFKGIFVRNLRLLQNASPHSRYRSFVLRNDDSVWTQVHPPEYHFGEVWKSPFASTDASTQSSALDLLVAAAQVSREGGDR